MSERPALLRGLGRTVRKGPQPVAVLDLAYTGAGSLVIEVAAETLTLTQTGSVTPIALDDALTFDALVTQLTAVPGVSATLVDASYGPVLAATLLDEAPRTVGPTATTWHAWTSPLWRLLEPARRRIATRIAVLDNAIAQLNLLTAAGYFAERWGARLGIVRKTGEDDATYTARQLRETIRPRESNLALGANLTEDHGVRVREVRDHFRDVFLPSRTPLKGHYLPGWRYNVATAGVRLDDFPTAGVIADAHAHAAAGVTVFVEGEDVVDAPLESGVTFTTTPLQIGDAPPMQIGGDDQIGIGKIGS